MRKIVEKARDCRERTSCCGWDRALNDLLPGGSLFQTIQSEIDRLDNRTTKMESRFQCLFGELKEKVDELLLFARHPLVMVQSPFTIAEPVRKEDAPESTVTDKNGKPEGGLKKGDLIHHVEAGSGIFEKISGNHAMWGWFEGYAAQPALVGKKNITFILRPEKDWQ